MPDSVETLERTVLVTLKNDMREELISILAYWKKYSVDELKGGFYGSVDLHDRPDPLAAKGVVLCSRICWAFSAAYQVTQDESDLEMATRAYDYLVKNFIDPVHGGVYWSVNADGKKLSGRKQIYGLAFCIYGFSEYFKVTKDPDALAQAKDLFFLIEEYSRDKQLGGYTEAFTEEWRPLEDLRLSAKDENQQKTMNTHLHVIEAYANLYQSWPHESLRMAILDLIGVFDRHFFNKETNHLNLFFDENWKLQSTLQSYGHDIEAGWLLQDCAEVIGDAVSVLACKQRATELAEAVMPGLDKDGGLWYEYEPASELLIREKHSWPQAEALVGFFNSWQNTAHEKYLRHALASWTFIKEHLKDKKSGEWFWGINADYSLMKEDKAGFWKCPYHNTRACLEIMRRIDD